MRERPKLTGRARTNLDRIVSIMERDGEQAAYQFIAKLGQSNPKVATELNRKAGTYIQDMIRSKRRA